MDDSYMDFLDMIEEGLIKIKALADVLLGANQDLLDETTLPCLAGMIESEADLLDHLTKMLFRALMGASR